MDVKKKFLKEKDLHSKRGEVFDVLSKYNLGRIQGGKDKKTIFCSVAYADTVYVNMPIGIPPTIKDN